MIGTVDKRIIPVIAVIVLLCIGVFHNLQGFTVRISTAPGGYYDEYMTRYARDHALSKRFADEIGALVFAVAAEEVPEVTGVSADIFIRQGRYPPETVYTVEIEEPVHLHVSLRGDAVTKAEFVDRCVAVRDAVSARGFRAAYFGFDYRWSINREGFGLELEESTLGADPASILSGDHVYRIRGYKPGDGSENWRGRGITPPPRSLFNR